MVTYLKVKTSSEWMGHPKGSILDLNVVTASQLIERGTAVMADSENGSEKADKDTESKGTIGKDLESPPKDKMLSRPGRQK